MAVLCCLIVLIYLETTLCIEDTNSTENVNITLGDTKETSSDRNESLDFTDLEVSETPDYFPAPAAWTPESVTVFPDQTESSESSIPATSAESPRAATAAQPLSGVLPTPLTEGENAHSMWRCFTKCACLLVSSFPSVSPRCSCNLQDGQCDIDCCCDPDCAEELALFTDCTGERVRSALFREEAGIVEDILSRND